MLEWWNQLNKPTQFILGLFGTIVLGAAGSGLWERVGSHLFDSFFELVINVINFFFDTYKDSLYREVSNGFHEIHSLNLYLIFLVLLPLVTYYLIRKISSLKKWLQEEHEGTQGDEEKIEYEHEIKLLKKIQFFVVLLFSITLITSLLSYFKHIYVNKITTSTFKAFEIIRPYINENEYLKLKSQFYLIKNSGDYKNIKDKLEKIGSDNNISLEMKEDI